MSESSKKQFTRGILLRADDVAVDEVEGELKVGATSKELHAYLDGALRSIITADQVQTLTNKTIDADENTIANLEVDNLKAGVLDTDLTTASALDDTIPSAKAVKAYVDSVAASQNEASEITFAPVGNIAATTVQAMGQELDADLTSEINRATTAESTLQTNIDTEAASRASADTALQTNINSEATSRADADTVLQTNIDNEASTRASADTTLQTNIDSHINDTTDAHDASAISNVPSGNLAATDMQGAVNELQSDIDTRALQTSLDTTNTNLSNEITRATNAEATKVTKAASSTDNALARFDGTTGALVQNSTAVLTDAGELSGLTNFTVDNINIDGNTITGGTSSVGIGTNLVTTTATEVHNGAVVHAPLVNSTTTGANAFVNAGNNKTVILTNASLLSIDMIVSNLSGQEITLVNRTGVDITLNHDTGATASYRIKTPTSAAVTFPNNSAFNFIFDTTGNCWAIAGGTGSGTGGASLPDTFVQLSGDELLATWSTGNNASFLGGGTLAGTFAYETSAPLNGTESYKFTQAAGSLNDYIASPVQSVALRFRGQNCILSFPYTYNGNTNDIRVVVYDVTNGAEIPSSVYLSGTGTTNTVFSTYVTIPTTCTQIRVGYKVAVVNSGKILNFDDVQVGQTSLYVPQPTTETLSYVQPNTSVLDSTNEYRLTLASFVKSGTGILSVQDDSANTRTKIVALKRCDINVNWTVPLSSTGATAYIYKNGAAVQNGSAAYAAQALSTSSYSGTLEAGDYISVGGSATVGNSAWLTLTVLAESTSDHILTVPETFSTDTAPLTYASSSQYTLSTLANAPVGTFITYTYTVNTNTRVQTTTAPSQTSADMNSNGIIINARPWNVGDVAATPSVFAIQIGKGLKGSGRNFINLYKATGKTNPGRADYFPNGAREEGLSICDYSESTGILIIDAGSRDSSSNTIARFTFSDLTVQTGAYLTINASKNPALTGIAVPTFVGARYTSNSGQAISASVISVKFEDIDRDTNSAYNTSTGVYTVPETGWYHIDAAVWGQGTYTTGQVIDLYINAAGSSTKSVGRRMSGNGTANGMSVGVQDTMYLVKNDTVTINIYSSITSSLSTGTDNNWLSITKVS